MSIESTESVSPVKRIAPLSLRTNFSWTFVGNTIYNAAQWGMLVVLARLGNPEMVGLFALGLAITAPVIMFTNLQLNAVLATDAKGEYVFGDYFGLRLITTVLGYIIILGIAAVTYQDEFAIIALIGLAKAFEALSDVAFGLLQLRERMDRIAISMIIKGPTSLVALAVGVLLTDSVAGGAIGMVLVWAALFLLYDMNSVRLLVDSITDIRPKWDFPLLLKLTWLALPLGFVMMLISLNASIPRIFVERYMGEGQLGIFAAMAYLIVAANTVVLALGQSAMPRLAKYYAEGNRPGFVQLLYKMIGVGVVLAVGGVAVTVVAGEFFLSLVYGSEYADEADVLIWIMVAAGVGYVASFIGFGVTATRKFKPLPVIMFVTVVVNVVVNIILIPEYGLEGAAWGMVVVSIVQLTLLYGYLLVAFNFSEGAQELQVGE